MYRLQCVIHNVRKRRLFQLVLHYSLDVCKPTVEHLVDVSPDRAIRVRLLVKMEQSLFGIHAADRLVDVVERDRVERLCQFVKEYYSAKNRRYLPRMDTLLQKKM